MVFSGHSGFLHKQNWPPRYNWNIVESGVKHNKPKTKPNEQLYVSYPSMFVFLDILTKIQATTC
jgi:hypothetical protein